MSFFVTRPETPEPWIREMSTLFSAAILRTSGEDFVRRRSSSEATFSALSRRTADSAVRVGGGAAGLGGAGDGAAAFGGTAGVGCPPLDWGGGGAAGLGGTAGGGCRALDFAGGAAGFAGTAAVGCPPLDFAAPPSL